MAVLMGVYKIQSIVKPNRCYVGSSINILKRRQHHICDLNHNRHPNPKLQAHFNKYGKNDLQFSILIGCVKEDLIATEQFFIDSYKPWFNNRRIAENNLGLRPSEKTKSKISEALKGRSPWNKGKPAYNKGKPMSDETKIKIREARKLQKNTRKGVPHSAETKKRLSEINKGKKLSVEQKKKISEGLKGRECSKVTRRKISEAQKGKKRPLQSGENHHSYGKIYSPEEREKMRQARKKQTTTRKGVPCSEETKQRLRLINLGKRQSEETIKKRRESRIHNCLIKKLKVA